MDFLIGLAAYLFLGAIVAFYAKNLRGERTWEGEGGKYLFLIFTIGWPVLLIAIAVLLLGGAYKKEK